MASAAVKFDVPHAPDGPLTIDPGTSTLFMGNTHLVNLVASDMVDLYGVVLELTFDPTFVEVVDDDPGPSSM